MVRSIIGVVSIAGTLALALTAMAQDYKPDPAPVNASGRTLGTVVQGNRTIIFAPADTRDIDAEKQETWEDFAASHPNVAKELAYQNSLIDDGSYLSKHPALEQFFVAHPDIKQAMTENPGNFVAIQPRPGE